MAPTPWRTRVTALAGGVGAARLLRGIARLLPPSRLTVIVNIGDDEEFYGLQVSPDLDTIVYNLSGVAPPERGWGITGDSQKTLSALRRFYPESWFQLGDLDLATHLFRTHQLRSGRKLHQVTEQVARAFGVRSRILPMSNDRVRTIVRIRGGRALPFQVYFVKRGARDRILGVSYRGLARAKPAPGVLASLRNAEVLLIPPSNPFSSIRPILGLRGVDNALRTRRAPLVAVSPVAGGRAVRGPLGEMLRAQGLPVSPVGIAEIYNGLLDGLVIDSEDRGLRPMLERRGLRVAVTGIRMDTIERSRAVAEATLKLAGSLARG